MPDSFKIDAHVHVFTTDMPLIDNPRHAPTYSFTHADLIATLDQNGIDRAVIAAASPWGDYNDYMLEAVRAYPSAAARHRDFPAPDGAVRAGGDEPRRFRWRAASLHRAAGTS